MAKRVVAASLVLVSVLLASGCGGSAPLHPTFSPGQVLRVLRQHGIQARITYRRAGHHQTSTTTGIPPIPTGPNALLELFANNQYSESPHIVAAVGTPSGKPLPEICGTVWAVGDVTAVVADTDSYWRSSTEGQDRLPCGEIIERSFRVANVYIFAWRPRISAVAAAVHQLRLEATRT